MSGRMEGREMVHSIRWVRLLSLNYVIYLGNDGYNGLSVFWTLFVSVFVFSFSFAFVMVIIMKGLLEIVLLKDSIEIIYRFYKANVRLDLPVKLVINILHIHHHLMTFLLRDIYCLLTVE